MITPLSNESAITRYSNAADILDHARNAAHNGHTGYRSSRKRMELAGYAMELLADEKNEEERQWVKMQLRSAFNALRP